MSERSERDTLGSVQLRIADIGECGSTLDVGLSVGECGSTLYVGLSGTVRNLIQKSTG